MTVRLCPIQLMAVLLLLAGCARTETVEQSCRRHAAAKTQDLSGEPRAEAERAEYQKCLKNLLPTPEEQAEKDALERLRQHCRNVAEMAFIEIWTRPNRDAGQAFLAGRAKKLAYRECMQRGALEEPRDTGTGSKNADDRGAGACLTVFDRLVADNKRKGFEAIDKVKKSIADLNLDTQKSQDLTFNSVRSIETATEQIGKNYELSLQLCLEGKITAAEWYGQQQTLPQP